MENSFTFLGMDSDYNFHWSMTLLFIPLIHRLWWDRKTIVVRKQNVNHAEHTTVTVLIAFVLSWIIWKTGPARYLIQPFLLSGCIFIWAFDYILNLLRGESWYYMSESVNAAWTDGIWNRCGVWGTLFAKWWFLLLGFSVYFYLSLIV